MSSTSLYGNTGNVTVSANNLTTLYNAVPGNAVVANVPDRNFVTLYAAAGQSEINPTRAYGNSNVEAFLNVGHDGPNIVQNITMSGMLTVGGSSYLGNVGNVHIAGGNSGYVLTTNGVGNLIWAEAGGANSSVEYIHFDVSSTANNQQFTDVKLFNYASANVMAVFKNGVNLEPSQYQKASANVLQINILLNAGDTIDVLPSAGGGGSLPGGLPNTIQFNDGYGFNGSNTFTFNSSTQVVTVGNLVVANTANLGNLGNIHIGGGNSGYVLSTDGNGNLAWTGAVANTNYSIFANYANYAGNAFHVDAANISGIVANANYANYAGNAFSVAGANVSGEVSFAAIANSVSGGNVVGYVDNATHSTVSDSANLVTGANVTGTVANATYAVVSGTAYSVSGSNVTGTVANANYSVYAGTATTANSVSVANVVGIGNIATLNLTGSTSNVLYGNGTFAAIPTVTNVANANFSNYAGNVTVSSQSNITSLGNLISLTVAGTTLIQQAKEKVTTNATGSTGTITYDILTQAILLKTANATGNFILNIRGNSTVTFNTFSASNESTTLTYVNKNGTTGYVMTGLQIDGVSQTLLWANGVSPVTGTTSGYDVYNFNIIKTAANTYAVFSTVGGYK